MTEIGRFNGISGENTNLSEIPWRDYLARKAYNKDINQMCSMCIKDQISKHGQITIKCDGILSGKAKIPEQFMHHFSEEEMDIVEQSINPYYWAEKNIDIKNDNPSTKLFMPRWYQEQFLRCSARRKTIRAGRRIGKALSVDTLIPTPSGFKKMLDIEVGDIVFDENGNQVSVADVTDPMYDHVCYEVEFSDGTSIIADEEHLWTVETKNIRKNNARRKGEKLAPITISTKDMLKDLRVGTKNESNYSIALTKPLAIDSTTLSIDPYILGYWLGDGNSADSYFTIGDEDIFDVKEIFNKCGQVLEKSKEKYRYVVRGLYKLLREENLLNNKHIPEKYFWTSEAQRFALMQGLLDSDGHCRDNGKVEFSNSNKSLSDGVLRLAHSLGIKATINANKSYLNGKEHKTRYRVYLNTNQNVFRIQRKNLRITDKYRPIANRRYIINIKQVDTVPVKCIGVLSKSNLYLAGEQCVPTHNTQGITMGLLHKMLTTEKYYVLVVAPYDAQAEEIYVKAKQILNNLNEPYDEIVESAKESPNYQIKLRNGSRLRCFTAGSSGAAQVRGQPANLIYIDEVDYLGQKDFNSILAILLDKPDTELWVTSTPDGEKQLYRLSQDRAYKEFHFPSFVLPHYNDDIDNDLRSQSDDMGYVQEVMAEFGTSRAGVFQKYFIDLCSKLSINNTDQASVLANRRNYIITMGCDWNHEGIGTRIVVLAYDRVNKLFFIVDKATVSKEGWTQTAAMEKIIELNRKYVFDKVYVDRGFGYTQVETLKSFAIAQFGKLPKGHPDLMLAEIVGVDFSSKIEVQDPYTNQMVKKDVKPFMVSILNKVIEKVAIKFDEKFDLAIIAQLKGYEEKRSASGKPTYFASSATVGDHDLDALLLAMFAFNVEYDEIFSAMKSQLAINVLSAKDVHGKDIKHLNPNHNQTTLEIKTKKRDNYSPGSRTASFKRTVAIEEKGSPGEIRSELFDTTNWHGLTNRNRTTHRRASFK